MDDMLTKDTFFLRIFGGAQSQPKGPFEPVKSAALQLLYGNGSNPWKGSNHLPWNPRVHTHAFESRARALVVVGPLVVAGTSSVC